jgi:hypothetical protein
MKGKLPLYLNISKPCNQNWDEMQQDGEGSYCSHCQQQVIDFTSYSDAALYHYFEKKQGKVCGRFLSTQLQRHISMPPQPKSRLYQLYITVGLTLLFTKVPEAKGQALSPPVSYIQPSNNINVEGKIQGSVVYEKTIDTLKRNFPINTAKITVMAGGKIVATTYSDSDGLYRINAKAGRYDVKITANGMTILVIAGVIVSPERTTLLDIKMDEADNNFPDRIIVKAYKVPLIDKYEPGGATMVTGEVH